MITTEQIHNARILIVDDEPANVMLLEQMLKQEGYTSVHSLTDPREAAAQYRTINPELVLLDLNMPHMNGFQVLEQLKEIEKEYYAPVMILTAQPDHQTRINALDAGAKDFLSKPFDLLEVSIRIRNMLEVRLLNNQVLLYNQMLADKVQGCSVDLAAAQLRLEHEMFREEGSPEEP
ncbi:MAG: response regulator [Nitrospinaceae bacterium]